METIYDYLREYSADLENRVMQTFVPRHDFSDPLPPELSRLRRKPLPAQAITIAGIAKGWNDNPSIKVVGECGVGKTYVGMSSCYTHAHGRRHTVIVQAPPHLCLKWSREFLITIPNARTFIVHDFRNGGAKNRPHGIHEYRLVRGALKRQGWHGSLADLRRMGRKGWEQECPEISCFIVSREAGKLSYFWRHAYAEPSDPRNKHYQIPLNPDTWSPVHNDEGRRMLKPDFDSSKVSEIVKRAASGTTLYSPLWCADKSRIQRMAPLDYIGRHFKKWFDYAIADEVHELAGDTAQGNGLAVLQRAAKRTLALTGTLSDGYCDTLQGLLRKLDAPQMIRDGFTCDGEGRRAFQATYGTIEEITRIRESDNKCSDATKTSIRIKRKPGTSPQVFSKYLLKNTAFLYLEDISDALPAYTESVISVTMDDKQAAAYEGLEEAFKDAIKQFPKAKGSISSLMLNTLMLYPDHPFGFDTITARVWDGEQFIYYTVAEPPSLPQDVLYPKEKALLDEVKAELAEGRRSLVFCTYTGRRDMTARLADVLRKEGIRVAVLRSSVPTDKREAWFAARVADGVDVVICHPMLVMTGLDLLDFPTILWCTTGYSLHVLRQASRRSWRIGQKRPVRVKFLIYSNSKGTAQGKCLRLMGRKTLVAAALEGKLAASEGLSDYGDDDTDLLTALARELVEDAGIGESASDVWKSLERERSRLMSATPAHGVSVPDDDSDDVMFDLPAEPSNDGCDVAPAFADQPDTSDSIIATTMQVSDWNAAVPQGGQLSLFG